MENKKKDTSKAQPLTTDSTQVTEIDELQKAIEKEFRTDHLTLPAIALVSDPVRDEASAREREFILNPNDEEITNVDGSTHEEWRNRILYGIMDNKDAMEGIGKHVVEVGKDSEGQEAVLIKGPFDEEAVAITTPKVNMEGAELSAGSELMIKTAPVAETNITTPEDVEADANANESAKKTDNK